MPHLLVDRIRLTPASCCSSRKKGANVKDATGAFVIEGIDIVSTSIFLIGRACFLPSFQIAGDLDIFLFGCILCVISTTAQLGLSTFTFAEAIYEQGLESFEVCENSLYMVGSLFFNVGTFLYWPETEQWSAIAASKEMLPGQFFNWFSPAFEGTVLLMLGSIFYVMAAYVNGLNQRGFDTPTRKMLSAATTCYMCGGLCFLMGSVASLPELGCRKRLGDFGAALWVIGCAFYLIGSVISLIRTTMQLEEAECTPMVRHRSPKVCREPRSPKVCREPRSPIVCREPLLP